MRICKSKLSDIKQIQDIYSYANNFMKMTGNPNQWINGYPSKEIIINDIVSGNSYICINEMDEIVGTFCFILGIDPTYSYIESGKWLNDLDYGTIHRLASNGKEKKISKNCIDFCFNKIPNLRADTHIDNIIMQKIFTDNGFIRCGIIYVANGSSRIAYQKCF